MDNLKHLYFFESFGKRVGLRYTIGQVLYDLVTVPEDIHRVCGIIYRSGAPRTYKPSFYMLKHAEKIKTAVNGLLFNDFVFLCNRIGLELSNTRNNKALVNLSIANGGKCLDPIRINKTKNIKILTETNPLTNNQFTATLYYLPDFDVE